MVDYQEEWDQDKSQKKIGNLKLIDIVIENAISQVNKLALTLSKF